MTKYTQESIEKATLESSLGGEYLHGDFEDNGDYSWEVSFGEYAFLSKLDIKALYEASLLLEEEE